MESLFGTDGVRGVANRDLTPDLVLALGRAAGGVLAPGGGEVVVGRDTRLSGPMLEGALVAGLCSAGARVRTAGVIPTPAVAWLTLDEGAGAGAVISASHNPVPDNGIKFFSGAGVKISGELEAAIERELHQEARLPEGALVGDARPLPGAVERYVEHLASVLDESLGGLPVVLDCAHGAACEAAPAAFERCGARVIAIHQEADGARINVACGSTSLKDLSAAVLESGAALGLAFDGDADRVLAVDEKGEEVDGDRIIALSAVALMESGHLVDSLVVTTVMANLGFRRALGEQGIEVISCQVGDRYVAEAMIEHGAVLGGEQSGHVIFGEHSLTGDGILTGLKIAGALAASGSSMSSRAHFFEPFPQVLINVPVVSRDELAGAQELWATVRAAEQSLGQDGRVLLRASGTEPVVRVMVEASDEGVAGRTARHLAGEVERHLGAG